MREDIVYMVYTEIDPDLKNDHFNMKVDAINYGKSIIDYKPRVEAFMVRYDDDGHAEEVVDHEIIWTYADDEDFPEFNEDDELWMSLDDLETEAEDDMTDQEFAEALDAAVKAKHEN